MKIVFVRHGESIANKNGIIQGHSDYSLSELGLEQSGKTADTLAKDYKFDAIYSSDLIRAKETVEIIIEKINITKINFDERLREINLGIFEGRNTKELTKEEKEYLDSCWIEHTKRLPNGENVEEMISRVKSAFIEITQTYDEDSTILVVAHGGTLFHIIKSTLNLYPEDAEWFKNCSINELSRKSGDSTWVLTKYNNEITGEKL